MRGIPGSVGPGGAIEMPEHSAAFAAAGPAGEHVVLVGRVAEAIHFFTLFRKGRRLCQSIAGGLSAPCKGAAGGGGTRD